METSLKVGDEVKCTCGAKDCPTGTIVSIDYDGINIVTKEGKFDSLHLRCTKNSQNWNLL